MKLKSFCNFITCIYHHFQVSAWLQAVFGSDPVPQYEISSFTVGVLHDLMLKNRLVDRQSALILEDRNQKTEEYAAEGKDLIRGKLVK